MKLAIIFEKAIDKKSGQPPVTCYKLVKEDIIQLNFIPIEPNKTLKTTLDKLAKLAENKGDYSNKIRKVMPRKECLF